MFILHRTTSAALVACVALLAVAPSLSQAQDATDPPRESEGYLLAAVDREYCRPERCTGGLLVPDNETLAAEWGFNLTEYQSQRAAENFTALDDYFSCLQWAGDVKAFQCHCTIRMYECMTDEFGGNCTKWGARYHCRWWVVDQGLGCAQSLCRAAAAPRGATLLALVAAVGAMVLALIIV